MIAIYLIIFPFILFSPKKIKTAIKIIIKLKPFFHRMVTFNFFTLLIIVMSWALLILEAFILMNIYTAGTMASNTSSFFYLYTGVYLSHPALLAFYFFGVYWFFGTLISWHKYFTSSAVCLWYFQ